MKYCELGKLIKSERDKRGWEQADLATLISKDKQAVSRWENGDYRPRQNDLLKLVDIFHGDVDEWLSKAGYPIEESDLALSPFLPLNTLSPENFELFCRDLIQKLNPGADVDRYGSQGFRQEGIDLYAKNSSCVLDYQCKRHKQFGPLDVKNTIEATTFKASHHHILLSRRGTPKIKKAMIEYDNWSLWDQEIISSKVRNLPKDDAVRIVDTYFPAWRKRFLGVEAPSPWLTPNEFYLSLQNKRRIFSHGWQFVGRLKEMEMLKEFEEQTVIRAIILSGRGGLGKSRLLRAWSERIEKSIKVIFVSPAHEITLKDLELLPKGPSYLVIDDAHDRVDIVTILNGVARLRPEMKIVISSRPYGLIPLKDAFTRNGIAYDPEKTITLNDLSTEDAKNLAEEILTELGGEIQYAQRIAEITKDCPFATVIGSRLVSEGQIKPELLNNNNRFSEELFYCFRKVVAGEIGGSNSEAIRDLLNFLSMIQPINPLEPIFKESAEELLNKPFDKINRDIRALEDGGVLLRRGNGLRIVPDLLADYIRADASYDKKNKLPTGYADRVFSIAKNELATNLLTNISQLDWRLLEDGIQSRLLDGVWSILKEQFLRAKILMRSEILTLIKKVAYYQPSHALDIVRIALEKPTDEVEEDYLQIRITQPSYKFVLEKIPPILRDVAYHDDYLSEALDILKHLAEIDERSTNNYPDHPIRILKDLASYEPRKPIRYNEIVLNHLISWLKDPSIGKFSPFDVLDELLQTEGYQTEARGFTITWKSFKVRPEIVSDLRKRVIDVAFDVIKTQPLKEGLRALKIIDTSLRFTYGNPKQNIDDSDVLVWESGILETLRQLEDIVKDIRLDPFISTEVRSIVSWHSNYSKTITKAAAKRVLNAIPVTSSYEITRALVDSWGWTFEKEDGKAGRNEEALVKWRDDLAKNKISEYKKNFSQLIETLEDRVSVINDAAISHKPEAGSFLAALMDNSSEFAEFLGRYLLANPKSSLTPWFPTVIAVIAKNNRNLATEFAKSGIEKNDKTLTQCVTLALSRSLYSFPVLDEEIEIIKQLAHYKDPWVRHTIVRAVKRFPLEKKHIALDILLSIDFSDSKEITNEVLGEFEEKQGTFKPEDLSNNQLQQLLAKLVKCPSIDDYNINLFFRKISFLNPEFTLKLLMKRVEYKETINKFENYEPLPYFWEKSESLRFYETAKYENILRAARNWVTEKTDNRIRSHYGSQLFKLISAGFDRVTLKVLEEWVISPDQSELEAVADLLSEAERNFIWDNQQFVISILERAQKFGSTCYKSVFSSLYPSVIQGVRSGTPGQPFPEDIEQRNRSQELMLTLPVGSPAYKFYKTLYENAIAKIEQDIFEDSERE